MSEPVWIGVCAAIGVFFGILAWTTRQKAEASASASPSPESTPSPASKPSPESKSSPARAAKESAADLPQLTFEEDEDVDPTLVASKSDVAKTVTETAAAPVPTKRIIYDEDAAEEEPTQPAALILVTASAQTDRGMRRKRNEDSLLMMEEEGVFVVADGMGGYRGGEIASSLAVQTIERAFRDGNFEGAPHSNVPRRASELVRALQMGNEKILARAESDTTLAGMGTTVCAARFSPNKQRLYVAHVGDSRLYRFRKGKLKQMTSDHTMRDFGVTGEGAAHLSRAVGVWPIVAVDVILGKPLDGDVYLLCSDGLTKMLDDDGITQILGQDLAADVMVDKLIAAANAGGGKDNITVILVRVYGTESARMKTAS